MESNDKLEQLLRQMYAEEADTDTSNIVDEEWARFEAKHFKDGRLEERKAGSFFSSIKKVAAAIIGVLLLSGVAYAAIYSFYPMTHQTQPPSNSPCLGGEHKSSLNREDLGGSGSVIFDDARLDSVLSVVAGHYQKQVAYRSDNLRSLRFLIEWNPEEPITTFINLINNFEGIHVSEAGDTIVVCVPSASNE